MAKDLFVIPMSIKDGNLFIEEHHRHHRPTARNGGRWALGALHKGELVGVAIASHPVSATYMDGFTIEVARLCVSEQAPLGTCSFLLSKCAKIWKTMGGRKILTYTLKTESGASLRGAGFTQAGIVKPHKRWLRKERQDGVPRERLKIYMVEKIRWERNLSCQEAQA